MKLGLIGLLIILALTNVHAQPTRQVQVQNHVWLALLTQSKINSHWSIVAETHMRRTNFLKDNNFYFLRLAAQYQITKKLTVQAGVGKLWLANKSESTELFSNENRLIQQIQWIDKTGGLGIAQRLRIEERWVQKVKNSIPIEEYRYSTRFRYQLALQIPIFKDPNAPSLALADELMLQTGKGIVYNLFDQNRLFAGIRQPVTKTLALDAGYMLINQQKQTGYQFTRNHTARIFLYWQPDISRGKPKNVI